MALFNQFPWTNFHELNLDWLLQKVVNLEAAFPEGTIGIPKGGTGATTAEDARANLGVYGINIPLNSMTPTTIDEAIQEVAGDLDELAEALNYKMYRNVEDLGQTAGAATVYTLWLSMSAGDLLMCGPEQLDPVECPETYGTLILIRSGAGSGYCLFAGQNHLYRKTFYGNMPQSGWSQVFTDEDIIPITKGGTGATNAADARTALGIDFSGTVLSVAGVGADTAGNVPLKLDNLVYTALSELGLASGSTLSAVWTALPDNSLLIANGSDIADPPVNTAGSLEIYKGTATVPGFIRFHGKESSTGDYAMYLTAAGAPSGTWEEVGAGSVETTDLTSQCTFPKGTPGHAFVLKTGKMVQVFYQGPSTTYAASDTLITMPVSLDSDITSQVSTPFTLDNVAFGSVVLNGNTITVNQISSSTGNHRIYFQMAFPAAD